MDNLLLSSHLAAEDSFCWRENTFIKQFIKFVNNRLFGSVVKKSMSFALHETAEARAEGDYGYCQPGVEAITGFSVFKIFQFDPLIRYGWDILTCRQGDCSNNWTVTGYVRDRVGCSARDAMYIGEDVIDNGISPGSHKSRGGPSVNTFKSICFGPSFQDSSFRVVRVVAPFSAAGIEVAQDNDLVHGVCAALQ